jgi:hypothetical protein
MDSGDQGGVANLTFANFTAEEWIAALTPAYGSDGAKQFAEILFGAIREKGSNGYSLPMEHWALLARLSKSAEVRVAEMTRDFPEACLLEIAAHRRAFDSDTGR